MADTPLAIRGVGCLSRLGPDLGEHLRALALPPPPFAPLAAMPGVPAGFEDRPGAWIEPRATLADRQWSPLAVAARHVAGEALAAAGWNERDRAACGLFLGSSRGALAGWLDPWPGRRPFDRLAAANSLTSEPATLVSAEFGIRGPQHVVASGCCAGLDALALALLHLRAGLARRALVVAVELPLTPPVLEAYRRSGVLASGPGRDDGLVPAEGAAALCLDSEDDPARAHLLGAEHALDPADPLGALREPAVLADLLARHATTHGAPAAILAHDSGTPVNRRREPATIRTALGEAPAIRSLKPWLGHAIGASGLLELALAASAPPAATGLPSAPATIFKIASALGGKHALASLRRSSS